jgi:acetoacetyl-CoA synthetase
MSTPTWNPDPRAAQLSQIASFEAAARNSGRVPADMSLHEWSVTDLDGFWSTVWDFYGVVGMKGDIAYRESILPNAVFFPDARLNIAENMLREWQGSAQVKVIESGEVDSGVGIRAELSGDDLVARVAQFAAALRARCGCG